MQCATFDSGSSAPPETVRSYGGRKDNAVRIETWSSVGPSALLGFGAGALEQCFHYTLSASAIV